MHLVGFIIRIYHEFHPDPARKLSANLYVLLCVQWKTPDGGQRNCPKYVELYSKNKFEQLVHLVGFIIRIRHLYFKKKLSLELQNLNLSNLANFESHLNSH